MATGIKHIKVAKKNIKYFILKPDNQTTARPPANTKTAVPRSGWVIIKANGINKANNGIIVCLILLTYSRS